MTAPGPQQLGRSVVVGKGRPAPAAWRDADRLRIDEGVLGDPPALEALATEAQRRYVGRIPTVYEMAVDQGALSAPETTSAPPHELGAEFSFVKERLGKAVWHNSYDARGDDLVWWWAHKAAARIGVTVGGDADATAADGTVVWIDGGPRQPLDGGDRVIHHESVDLGLATPVSATSTPSGLDLADDQLEAVSHLVGPARIIAPAGSGKTRVLTERIAHLLDDREIEPEIVTAVAYNRRAADEMAERLGRSRRLNIRTIHSLGWEILRMARPHLRLIDEREQRKRLEPITSAVPRPNTDVLGPYLEALGEVRIGLVDPATVEAERDDVPGFAGTFRRYRDALERAGEADHDEQIYGAIEALCADADLRAHHQAQCRHLLVDEFQDLTPGYLLLLRLVASPGLNVFGVGDDDQVIYGYAGADPRFLIDFDRLFPGAASHALEINYRCPTAVVAGAETLLGYNQVRVDKRIAPGPDNVEGGLTIETVDGAELAAAARTVVEGHLAGAEPDSVAVLARVNSALMPVHVALVDAGVPVQSPISPAVLERTVMRATLAWIRVALDPEAIARNDLFEIVRRPQRGITRLLGEAIGRRRGPFSIDEIVSMGRGLDKKRASRWEAWCDDIFLAARSTATTTGLLDVLADRIGLERAASALDAGRRRADRSGQGDDLAALRRVAVLGPAPESFEPWLRERIGAGSRPGGVVLSSVHRVKGLEWDHVVVFGADRGTMPHHLSSDIEEERRVFHVALTRGRRTVTVLADQQRPSRFLTELDGSAPIPSEPPAPSPAPSRVPGDGIHVEVGDRITITGGYTGRVIEILTTGALISVEPTGATMAVPWGETVQRQGRSARLTPGRGPADPELVDTLRSWRLEQARSQGVPAYVVFNDATLEELAARRPSTEDALLSVPGIGPAKLDAYGDDLLDLLA